MFCIYKCTVQNILLTGNISFGGGGIWIVLTSKGSERTHSFTMTILQGQNAIKTKPKQSNVLLTSARHVAPDSSKLAHLTPTDRREKCHGLLGLRWDGFAVKKTYFCCQNLLKKHLNYMVKWSRTFLEAYGVKASALWQFVLLFALKYFLL